MQDLYAAAARLAELLEARQWRLVTAESCTGGLLAAACTERAGSSVWFECGFVTYSNAAKTELLAVPVALIETHGAVSEAVACAMARGAIARTHAHVSVAITGIAGPGGGSAQKPVGTVWLAWCVDGHTRAECHRFTGDRAAVRAQATQQALHGLLRCLQATGAAH